MAGTNITIDVDDAPLREVLTRLSARVDDLTPAFASIGEHLVRTTWERFEQEKGPDGVAWEPLSEVTILRRLGGVRRNRKKRGGMRISFIRRLSTLKILTDTSRLRDSIAYRASDSQVEVGTNLVYAAIQQLGGQAGKGLRVHIPARPYLGLSDDDTESIHDILTDYLGQPL